MKKYPKYKPSGVEWIGDVPEGWNCFRIKNLLLSETNGIWGEEMQGDENDVVCLRVADFDRDFDNIAKTGNTYRNIVEKDFEKRKLERGDLLIEKSGGGELLPIGRVGLFEWENGKAVCSNFMARLRPNDEKIQSKFLFYIFKTFYIKRLNIRHIKQTTGIQNLDTASYFNEISPCPPIPEQTAIAAYLDRKTAQIDQSIAEKERLIELFHEERQAIINHAVTKGIRPGAKMKPSGLEWIGDVPEGWEVSKFKYYVRTKARLGWKGLKAEEYVESGYGFLSTPNIKGVEIDFEKINFITEERYQESPEIMLEEGDVLLAKDGSTLGIVNIVKHLPFPCTVNSSIAVLRVFEMTELHPLFLKFFIESDFTQNVIQNLKAGMGVPHLFQADINNFEILLPPIQEQTAIAIYIDQKTAQIDTAISGIRQEIALLQEYRQALIFEAVTGKIDVRENIQN